MRQFLSYFLLTAAGFIAMTASVSSAANLLEATGNTSPAIRITPPAPIFTDAERQSELARRRQEVAKAMADKSMLILFSAEPKLYANDVNYVFRQENDLYYLTALKQAGATLVMVKTAGEVNAFLFVPPRDPASETWHGRTYSNVEVQKLSGIQTVLNSAELPNFLSAIKEKRKFASADNTVSVSTPPSTIYLLLPTGESDRVGNIEYRQENTFAKQLNGYDIQNALFIFMDLRQIKSPYEIKLLQHAIDITTEAQETAWLAAPNAKMEYEVQAEVEYIYRKRNADFWGYPSIVGCGPNATTLHYEESQGPITPGQLLLMDVGAEYDHYTADVTRTIPVNGKFSKEQANIYRIVYNAQEAVAKAAKPGTTMAQINEIARNVISEGLFDLGLITDKTSSQVGIFYMHSVGHWLGMNVHDVGRNGPPLKAGMVFTNEPGIYIREDALSYLPDTPENRAFIKKLQPAFDKYKNIGVRIEDDMLVTETGVEWLTANLPRKLEDIEAFMAANPRPTN
jgi:Xaa-Pro aminopeptidase